MTENTPKPLTFLTKMMQDATDIPLADLPHIGSYAIEYGDLIKGELDGDNVQAFLYGAAVVNLLVQDAMLRTSMVARANVGETTDEAGRLYVSGLNDGVQYVAGAIAAAIEQVMDNCTEGPAYERAFRNIINQF